MMCSLWTGSRLNWTPFELDGPGETGETGLAGELGEACLVDLGVRGVSVRGDISPSRPSVGEVSTSSRFPNGSLDVPGPEC